MVGIACACVGGGLLLRPITGGFTFDSVLKETDEPVELKESTLMFCHCFSILLSLLPSKVSVFQSLTEVRLPTPADRKL